MFNFCIRRSGLVFCLLLMAGSVLINSCKKDSFISSEFALLNVTTDTLKYDTVFTTTGSITKFFKIINENNQKLRLSKIKLMGGAGSAYKMNVDGAAVNEFNDLDIEATDSIYVFVSVNINPNAANLPFIVSDSILINYNGNNRFVQLQAFGQNANFLRNRVITGNVVWTNTLPYVILGSIRIDTTASLTILPGCKIYSHADAPFIVDGNLTVNGTYADRVVFTGDRLDEGYKDLPASWPGIYFRGSSQNNILTYAIIKNAYQAVVSEKPSVNANPKLILHQCIIDNAYDAGIYCVNSSLQADNSLISNCGSNIILSYGGNYNLTHCTVAAYSTNFIIHENPALVVNNFTEQAAGTLTADLNAVFRNNIFWGDEGITESEVSVNKQGTTTFTVLFEKNIYRGLADPANSTLSGNILNVNPGFDSIDVFKGIFDFRITKNLVAPGINAGTATGFVKDLDNNNRNVGLPDLGCYEKQ
ncbi:MAG: hypothetical protein IPL84_07425 [Chitinophagaceae bacterium]|nr:hypothetical protein [Chitinophagaceae bacterium]